VNFEVSVGDFDAIASTDWVVAEKGQQGCGSLILIGRESYDAMIQSKCHQTPRERDSLHFIMAALLLHEMAHAATFHIMGPRPEDFSEDALVAEAGFDYLSSIFGMVPPGWLLRCRREWMWVQWQNLGFLERDSYPIHEHCRNASEVATRKVCHHFDTGFAERLLNDEWWEGAEDRSADLVPDFLLRRENSHLLAAAPACFCHWLERVTSGVQAPPIYRDEATRRPRSFILQIRQPTTPSSTASAL
jgi:hypothetical protein